MDSDRRIFAGGVLEITGTEQEAAMSSTLAAILAAEEMSAEELARIETRDSMF